MSEEDREALRMMEAAPQENAGAKRGLSLSASGRFQGNDRSPVKASMVHRSPTVPGLPLPMEDGIFNELPEVSFSLPLTAGIGINYRFSQVFSLGTGLRYTYMARTFVADYRDIENDVEVLSTDVDNHQHWLGLPLNAYFDVMNNGKWRVHMLAGGAAEFLVDNDFLVHNSPKDIHVHESGSKIQWSAVAGVGMEYRVLPGISIYLDPGIRYYFNTQDQPRSIRTLQPLRFEVELGLRWNLGK